VQPRLFMTTHMSYDPYVVEETVAEVREHWKGPFHFGAPDGIVVNVTKDQIWVREGILPDFPNSKAPQFDFSNNQLVVPLPPTSRQEIQNQEIRDQQLDPEVYYPDGYMPELLEEWPVDSDLVVPLEQLPDNLKKSMSDRWAQKQRNQAILKEQAEAQK
jgi:ribonuclease Z